ncbi:MAG: bifunctional 4-hydroxy-2-oxoglutarate aldolase/2-dehydro-3-deoxy-phosphogluconate aldolase [Ruminococcaceae bacterium]|nr:bifunctional 4-hydroxy-2-oxoglutarate aldolase/2-dehydro-3-deoxy-phosphogluconate aldolase [Oscillospiraceae bacterium]
MREQTIQQILEHKVIVIVRGVAKEQLIPMAEAMYAGGIRLLELTYCADGSTSDEDMAENVKMLAEHFAGRMLIGSGTVLTEKQVELTCRAGGRFIISPDACEEVIRKTRELGMVSIPGALTPTEIQLAHKAGADFVKLFPVANLGVGYIKNVKAPLSHIKFLAVGGVDDKNLKDYMAAGVCGIGVGGAIVDKKKIAAGDFAGITEAALAYTSQLN